MLLYPLILQSACAGFLFHWLISDAVYLDANPAIKYFLYFMFIMNMFGTAYGHTVITRSIKLDLALTSLNKSKKT